MAGTENQDTATATAAAADGHRTIERLADEMLPTLIARLAASNLGELEVREDGWRVRLRRPAPINGEAPAEDGPKPARRAQASGTSRPSPGAAAAHAGDGRRSNPAPAADTDRGLVSSPAVGYFMLQDGIAVKSAVRQGDLIGHVDVLGVRHEVVATDDGTLRSLEVESGQAVEYGQPIARVEPEKRT